MNVEFKEKITERYPGDVYQRICRCAEWWTTTRDSVGIRCTGGFADMSGWGIGRYELYWPQGHEDNNFEGNNEHIEMYFKLNLSEVTQNKFY